MQPETPSEQPPRLAPWPVRAVMWLNLCPYRIARRLSDLSCGFWKVALVVAKILFEAATVARGATTKLQLFLSSKWHEALDQSFSDPFYPGIRIEVILDYKIVADFADDIPPYDPLTDALIVRRAALNVAGLVGALVLLGGLLVVAPWLGQHAGQWAELARACVVGWGR